MPGGNLRGATPPTDGESGDLPCVDKRDTKADRATPALPAFAGFVVIRTCPTGPGFGLTGQAVSTDTTTDPRKQPTQRRTPEAPEGRRRSPKAIVDADRIQLMPDVH
jgi:hypothetical protein